MTDEPSSGKDRAAATAFKTHLAEAVRFHGHLCSGQVLGVRMAMAGMRELGLDRSHPDWCNLVIFVEIDRCPVDAIISVTGRTPGKRSIHIVDYGKHAATFVNARTGQAVRVSQTPSAQHMLADLAGVDSGKQAVIKALSTMAEKDLLTIQPVRVCLRPEDMPGESLRTVFCTCCGEQIRDMREYVDGTKVLCRTCAEGARYYEAM